MSLEETPHESKLRWMRSDDLTRYKVEHRTFLIKIKRDNPHWDVFCSSRIFWKLGKLKERYPKIAEEMKDFKKQWHKDLEKYGIEEMKQRWEKL